MSRSQVGAAHPANPAGRSRSPIRGCRHPWRRYRSPSSPHRPSAALRPRRGHGIRVMPGGRRSPRARRTDTSVRLSNAPLDATDSRRASRHATLHRSPRRCPVWAIRPYPPAQAIPSGRPRPMRRPVPRPVPQPQAHRGCFATPPASRPKSPWPHPPRRNSHRSDSVRGRWTARSPPPGPPPGIPRPRSPEAADARALRNPSPSTVPVSRRQLCHRMLTRSPVRRGATGAAAAPWAVRSPARRAAP